MHNLLYLTEIFSMICYLVSTFVDQSLHFPSQRNQVNINHNGTAPTISLDKSYRKKEIGSCQFVFKLDSLQLILHESKDIIETCCYVEHKMYLLCSIDHNLR